MEKYCRNFVCCDLHFSGFNIDIDITQMDKIEDIIDSFKTKLILVLQKYNFENLIEEYKKKEFHIHDITFEQILTSDINEIFYICHH